MAGGIQRLTNMHNERYLLCEATGDRAELADYFLLRVTRYLLGSVDRLLEGAAVLNNKCGGSIDVTERGDVDFTVIYDLPDGDTSDLFARLGSWDFHKQPFLLPVGKSALEEIRSYRKVRRTECHGIQVWSGTKTVRLTCYPKEDTYRIETKGSIRETLDELRRDFNYEQEL